jgi:hypothetical protein
MQVPADATVRTTVVIPAFNEEDGLPVVLAKVLDAVDERFEVLVVDDGSTDGTLAAARRFPCRVVSHAVNRGKAEAMRTGIHAAQGENVIFIDADDTYPAELIPALAKALEDCDMAVGSRAGGHANIPAMNRVGNAIFRNTIRYCYGFPAYDPLTGFYGLKRRHLEAMQLQTDGFRIETEIAVKAARMGLHINDLPIDYGPRIGEAKLRGVSDGLAIFLTMLSMLPLYNPILTFVLPALFLAGISIGLMAASLGIEAFVAGAFGLVAAWQLILTGAAVSLYATAHRRTTPDILTRLFLAPKLRLLLGFGGIAAIVAGVIGFVFTDNDGRSLVATAMLGALGVVSLTGASVTSILAPAAGAALQTGVDDITESLANTELHEQAARPR